MSTLTRAVPLAIVIILICRSTFADTMPTGDKVCQEPGTLAVDAQTDHWVTGMTLTEGQSVALQVKGNGPGRPQTWGVIDPPKRGGRRRGVTGRLLGIDLLPMEFRKERCLLGTANL